MTTYKIIFTNKDVVEQEANTCREARILAQADRIRANKDFHLSSIEFLTVHNYKVYQNIYLYDEADIITEKKCTEQAGR